MTDKTTDSSQPESSAQVDGLNTVSPKTPRNIRMEEVDRDDPPVADLARELPSEIKEANRQEEDWSGAAEGDVNPADDAQDATSPFETGRS